MKAEAEKATAKRSGPEPAPADEGEAGKDTPGATDATLRTATYNDAEPEVPDVRPESLKGATLLELSIWDADGLLSPTEQLWYNKRRWKVDEHRRNSIPPNPLSWMGL